MDPQDKTRFEIQGKASVKYHLKANHVVEAKRWFWALNNAIQWTKDEAKEEERQKQRNAESLRQARLGIQEPKSESSRGPGSVDSSKLNSKSLTPATAVGASLSKTSSRVSFQESVAKPGSVLGDDEGSIYEPSITLNDDTKSTKGTRDIPGDVDDDDEYGDDASSHDLQPGNKDAFNITAHSASLQLDLLAQVSTALQAEIGKGATTPISDPTVAQAISTYRSAVQNLLGLVGDLLKIARDRDAHWQYRLDREADVRRMWEDSMAKVAKEQEELEGRIGESEDKRKWTKKALREALEGTTSVASTRPGSPRQLSEVVPLTEAAQRAQQSMDGLALPRRKSIGAREAGRRKSTIADLTNLSDSDSEEDEEFFDAVDAGEVEVAELPPSLPSSEAVTKTFDEQPIADLRESKRAQITPSFKGYEDPVRTRLKMDADDRPKISLWVSSGLTWGSANTNLAIGYFKVHDWQRHDKDDIAGLLQRANIVAPTSDRGHGIY